MKESDRERVIEMMRIFYASPAVLSNGSDEIFEADIDACVSDSPFLEGYIFERNGETLGYGMLAKSFSTEYCRECLWIEDLYVKPQHQGKGIGKAFFDEIDRIHPGMMLCLEVEAENENALKLYRKCGFDEMGYVEMKRIRK